MSWNDPVPGEELLTEAHNVVLNLSVLLDVAFDELNPSPANHSRALALVEIARDTARALAERMTKK